METLYINLSVDHILSSSGYRESIAVPATDQFEAQEREYKLTLQDDSTSLGSQASDDSDIVKKV